MKKSAAEIISNASEKDIQKILDNINEKELMVEMKSQVDSMSESEVKKETQKAGSEDNFLSKIAQRAIKVIVTKKILIGAGFSLTLAAKTAQAAIENTSEVGEEIFDAASEAGSGFLESVTSFIFG